MKTDTTTLQHDRCSDTVKRTLLYQVYLRLDAKQPIDRVLLRSTHLMALAAELDEAVCDEKPCAELREYISAIEYISAEIQSVCVRLDLERRKK